MQSGYSLERSKFSRPEEEIEFLHREIARLEQKKSLDTEASSQVETLPESVTATVESYRDSVPHEVLESNYKATDAVLDTITLGLEPEEHDDKMQELLRLMGEKGIKNTLSALARMNNPHLSDDFHRFLIQYLKNGYEIKGLQKKGDTERILKTTLFEVLIPHPDDESTGSSQRGFGDLVGKMEQFYSGMMAIKDDKFKKDVFTIEIALPHIGSEAAFYVAIPDRKRELFEKHVHAVFPEAQVREVKDDYNIYADMGVTSVSVASQDEHAIVPIRTYETFEHDPLNAILNSFSKIDHEGEGAAIQFVMKPDDVLLGKYKKALEDLRKGIPKGKALDIKETKAGELLKSMTGGKKKPKDKDGNDKPVEIDDQLMENVRNKIASPIMRLNVRIIVSAASSSRADMIRHDIESTFNQFESTVGNRLEFKTLKGKKKKVVENNYSFRKFSTQHEMPMNLKELTTMVHFPVTKVSENLKRGGSEDASAPVDIAKSGLLLGENDFRGDKTSVYIDGLDRLRHMYVIGQTGTGKSTFLKNLIVQDIQNGEGVCMIDPHGNDIDDVLGTVPPERYGDVIYFDPSNMHHPVGLNMLEYDTSSPEQKTFVVNEMLSIFNKLFDMKTAGGPMFEQYFRNSVMLAIDDPSSGSTLLDVSRVLADSAYREMKLDKCTNPVVIQFWREIAGKAGGQASLKDIVPYITSKFDVFLSNDIMRPIIAQQDSAFDFRQVMDERKILLINLSKGRLGDINAHLLGLIIVGKLLMAALSRVDGDLKGYAPFYLYLDEFQNVTTDSISQILSEARKYKLSLFIAHQFIKQLDEKIKDAVFGNVGTMVTFRVGADDAEYLEKQFSPVFGVKDIMNIDNRNAYIKMLSDGKPVRPFNFSTMKPVDPNPDVIARLKQLSAETYGRPRAEVEAEIMAKYQAGK